jgi:hypothetical protein
MVSDATSSRHVRMRAAFRRPQSGRRPPGGPDPVAGFFTRRGWRRCHHRGRLTPTAPRPTARSAVTGEDHLCLLLRPNDGAGASVHREHHLRWRGWHMHRRSRTHRTLRSEALGARRCTIETSRPGIGSGGGRLRGRESAPRASPGPLPWAASTLEGAATFQDGLGIQRMIERGADWPVDPPFVAGSLKTLSQPGHLDGNVRPASRGGFPNGSEAVGGSSEAGARRARGVGRPPIPEALRERIPALIEETLRGAGAWL